MTAAALRRGLLALLTALVLLPLFPSLASADPALPQGFQDTEVFKGLEQPTAVRFAPNGMVFVAEKAGKILVYEKVGDETPELFKDLRTEVYNHADRGLLGLAVDPEFPTKPYVYALFTYDHVLGSNEPAPEWGEPNQTGDECSLADKHGADDCLVSGRLVRYTANITGTRGNLHAVAGVETPLIPEDWCQQFSSHSIGDLRFGPEGALYASGGDGASFSGTDTGDLGSPANPCGDPPDEGGSLRSQDLRTPAPHDPTGLNGTIIRIDPETGAGWPTNPKYASTDVNEKRIVAFGFRNPFRFTTDPLTQKVYIANVGGSQFEEIDRIDPSSGTLYNSGWPCYEGDGKEYLFKELNLPLCNGLYHETEVGGPGAPSEPFFYYSHKQTVVPADECDFTSGSAISGLSFYEGDDFPAEYKGALFFSDSVRNCIYVMLPGADGHPDPKKVVPFMTGGSNYPGVDIQEGPDGALYYASLFGENFAPGAIHRITYAPGAPKARLSATPQWGTQWPFKAQLDASASSDPTGETLAFEWDLDGDGSFETDGGETQEVEFTKKELEEAEENEESPNKVLSVLVKDGEGNSSVARVTVYPGDKPPVPTVTSPKSTLTWKVGDQIHFEGSAVDGQGNKIDNSLYFYWSSWLYHCPGGGGCHAHPLQVFPGVFKGDLLAPEHDYPSYIEVSLRVTDERGLAATKTVRIDPSTVDVQIASEPPGVTIVAGLLSQAAPFDVPTIQGAQLVLSAPQTAELNGQTYDWQSWSDQGARSHAIVANSSGTYTAVYSAVAGPPPPGPLAPPRPANSEPPVTKLRKHPPKRTRSTTAKFVFGADKAGAGFTCKLDGKAKAPCRSPKIYKRLKPGLHTFKVWASADGLTDATPSKFSWKILPRKP
ncbi:MAG TPA: PQQ-dependent sugar dehydrogenase [Solirubrobacterales bacterium]|nr:PQQ-dependent sugar dehydrogenase [Solirubrobacterales bacterium]